MISRALLSALILFLAGCGSGYGGERPATPQIPGTQADSLKNPYFFLLKKDDHLSYLLGTYEIGVSISELPPFILQAMNQSNTVAFDFFPEELNSGTANSPFALLMQIKGQGKETIQWESLKPETQFELNQRGISKEFAETFSEPQLCIAYLFHDSVISEASLELELMLKAKNDGKTIISLDNEAFIKSVQEAKPSECMDNYAQEYTADEAQNRENKMLYVYRSGNVISPYEDIPAVTNRHRIWVGKLDVHHSEGMFIAVGAGHLFGNNGMIQLLEDKGFEVIRMTDSQAMQLETVKAETLSEVKKLLQQ